MYTYLYISCINCVFVHSGLVPLHNACSYGHYEVVELLVKVSVHIRTYIYVRTYV